MRNVRDILRGLVQDTKPSRGWVEPPPQPKEPEVINTPRTSTPGPGPVRILRKGHVDVPPAAHGVSTPTEVVDAVVEEALDPTCGHKWSWKNGKKFCWLCGGPAPEDRRDSSTRWKG